jgi:aspartyl-tRNA(Asn)/glutamyl-tRNA(Gln) amidotransferase subunit A
MTADGSELLELGLATAADLVARRQIAPLELTDAYLRRIEETDGELNAYVTVDADGARRAARARTDELATGGPRSPLHGIPIGVKDVIDTAGLRTTYGSARYASHVPAADAHVVAAARAAGAVLLGKHATHELAWGGRCDSPHFGPTRNPYDLARIPGGSSGGSAASLAAHSSLAAVGTDTAGSARIPAALSGCTGFKPTRSRLSMQGVLPLSFTRDHVGVLARTVADAALLYSALAPRAQAPIDLRAEPVRVGWLRGWPDELLEDGIRQLMAAARGALEDDGTRVVDVEVAAPADLPERILASGVTEAAALHCTAFAADPDAFGPDLAELLRLPPLGSDDRAENAALIHDAGGALLDALTRCDVLVCATVPVTAPLIGAEHVEIDGRVLPVEHVLTRLTSLVNVLGLPALSVPLGLVDGLPGGLQIIGRSLDERSVLALGNRVEAVLGPLPPPVIRASDR